MSNVHEGQFQDTQSQKPGHQIAEVLLSSPKIPKLLNPQKYKQSSPEIKPKPPKLEN